MRKERMDLSGALMLIGWAAILGLNQVLIKIVNAGFSPVFQAGLRSACGIIPVLIFAWATRKTLSVRDGSLLPGLIAGLCFSLEFMLVFQALDYTTVSRALVLFYTMPVWVAIGAHFLIPGEHLSPIRILGLSLCVAGVVAAMLTRSSSAGPDALLGDVMCLVGAMFWAAIALIAPTTAMSKAVPEMQLLYQLVTSAVVLLLVAPLFGDVIRELTPTIAAIFSIQVIVVVFIGFLAWFWLLGIYPASDVASFSFLVPVFGVGLSALILNEHITVGLLVALVLVASGIILINRR